MASVFCGVISSTTVEYLNLHHLSNNMALWQPERIFQWQQSAKETTPLVSFVQWTRFNTPQSKLLKLPLENEQQQILLCSNTRLDNRENLLQKFNWKEEKDSITDEELILRAYQEWGESCPIHLEGDFIFVIWDQKKRCLFTARDINGHKVLYYHLTAQKQFIFATNPQPILNCPNVEIKIDETGLLHNLIYGAKHIDKTYYQQIQKLPPASSLTLDDKFQIKVQQYWDPYEAKKIYYKDKTNYYEHFVEIFEQAVQGCLRSSYPIASHLSGGFDSSSVAAIAANLLQKQNQSLLAMGLVAPAWCVPKGTSADDSHYMEAVASNYPNIQLLQVAVDEQNVFSNISNYHRYTDIPITNGYNRLWLEKMCRIAQQADRRVLLTGQQGNYTVSWHGAPIKSLKSWLRIRGDFLIRLIRLLPQQLQRNYAWGKKTPISSAFASKHHLLWQTFVNPPRPIVNSVAQGIDRTIGNGYLAASEAMFGVESRDPTANRQIIEFCQGIPKNIFYNEHQNRLLIREGMKNYLPKALLQRNDRGLQSADWYIKFDKERPAFKKILNSLRNSEFSQYLDHKVLSELLDKWQLPDPKKEVYLDGQFSNAYQRKFLRGITTYVFLSQAQNLRKRKKELAKGKLDWQMPEIYKI